MNPAEAIPIGTIDGADVLASYDDQGLLCCTLRWRALELFTNGVDFIHIAPLAPAAGFADEWTLDEWQQIRACVALGIDLTLLALAKEHATGVNKSAPLGI